MPNTKLANSIWFCLLVFFVMDQPANAYRTPYSAERGYYRHHARVEKRSVPESPKQRFKDADQKVASSLGPRPSAWCGWYMRTIFGGGPKYNVARNWATRGSPTEPKIGAVVVWAHHVGVIRGKTSDGKWIVLSGNDSNAVKARPRSLKGVIAIREV